MGWAAELQRAGGMPNQRVVADCAEKKKGVTEFFSVTPFSDLMQLQDWRLRLNRLISTRIAKDKVLIHPQTYPHTPRVLRE